MSWHTIVQVSNGGDVEVAFETVEAVVASALKGDGIHPDVLDQLRRSFEQGEGSCNLHPAYLQSLFAEIAPLVTSGVLEVRCLGEEFKSTWIMCIEEGRVGFTVGPWGDE
jgi:hypothetical protein